MTSLKPYLVRAIYEWIVDNKFTPYLLVNANHAGTILPQEYIEDGRIILNLRPEAVDGLALGNELIEFKARFGGISKQIVVPTRAILAIYAKENGQGMVFDQEDDVENDLPLSQDQTSRPGKPQLKVVK